MAVFKLWQTQGGNKMRMRYCHTRLLNWNPCDVSWGYYSTKCSSTCRDEPMEENCKNIVDDDYLSCPTCGIPLKEVTK